MENKPLNAVDWENEILSWERSGISQKRYCLQKELHYHRFVYERNRLQQKRRPAGKFVPIKTVTPESLPVKPDINTMASGDPDYFILSSPGGYQLSVPIQSDIRILNRLLDFMGEKRC